MAIIYSTIEDEIKRKYKTPEFPSYLKTLFSLYTPKDNDKSKNNLFTIYLNSTNSFTDIQLFIDKGFKLQPEKIDDFRILDKMIVHFLKNDNLNTFLEILPPSINSCYAVLCLPTKYKFELYQKTYQKNDKFYNTKTNLIKDIFSYGTINCVDHKECEKLIYNLFDVFQTIYSDGGLKDEHIELLTNQIIMDRFLNQILNYKSDIPLKDISSIFNGTTGKMHNYQHVYFNISYDFKTIKELDTFSFSTLLSMKTAILSSRNTAHKPNKLNKI